MKNPKNMELDELIAENKTQNHNLQVFEDGLKFYGHNSISSDSTYSLILNRIEAINTEINQRKSR